MDWKKFVTREFLIAVALIIVASVALFTMDKVSFQEWAWACGAFVGIFTSGITAQKLKGVATGQQQFPPKP